MCSDLHSDVIGVLRKCSLFCTLEVYERMEVLRDPSINDALTGLIRSVQFLRNRVSLRHRDNITLSILIHLVDSVVNAYQTIHAIATIQPYETAESLLGE